MKRKWIRPLDVFLLLFVLLFALASYLWLSSREAGTEVEIYIGNEPHAHFTLKEAKGSSYTVTTAQGSMTLLFEEEGVRALCADCPDGICVRTGQISRRGESIVCVPLGVCVTVGKSDLDGVTG